MLNRRCAASGVVVVVAVLLATGCASRPGRPAAGPGASGARLGPVARAAGAEPEAALVQPIPIVDLDGVTLEQAIGSLGVQTGANLFVSWRVLADAGVTRDTPVNARLEGVALGKVLDLLLADAGGGDGKLGYRVDGDVIRVSTTVDLDRSAHLQRERARRAADAAVRERLERVVPEVAMKDVPVRQALEQLADDAGLRLSADWDTLAARGAKTDRPVSLAMRGVTVEEAIGAILSGAEPVDGESHLGTVVYRGRLIVVTADNRHRYRETRVIDVQSFLRPDESSRELPAGAPPAQVAPAGATADHGAAGRALSAGGYPLVKLIQEIVDPDSWRDNGGNVGAIALSDGPLRGVLIVSQTYENLEAVELLLSTLRGHLPPGEQR